MGEFWTSLAFAAVGPTVMLLYPLYGSMIALKSPKKDIEEWLTYWMLYSVLTFFESVLQPLLECPTVMLLYPLSPIWYTMKLLLVLWLVLPRFRGAALIYEEFVLEKNRNKVDKKYVPERNRNKEDKKSVPEKNRNKEDKKFVPEKNETLNDNKNNIVQPTIQKEERKSIAQPKIMTVVLYVPMHCDEGCSKDVKKAIERMKGVKEVIPDREKSQVTVKGTFDDPEKLKEYIYNSTRKIATIVKQDPPAKTKDKKGGKKEGAAYGGQKGCGRGGAAKVGGRK